MRPLSLAQFPGWPAVIALLILGSFARFGSAQTAPDPPTVETATPTPPVPDKLPPEKSPPENPASEKPPLLAGWDDGFVLRSADKQFSLRITGQVQSDYRAYNGTGDRTDVDSFLLRRARFGLEATLFQYYEFRFMPDLGQGQPRIQDGFLNVHYWDAFQVTAGKFKQPFSYEQLIQDRFTPFMERSLIDQLVPARDIGVMVHGQNLLDGMLDYGAAVANGTQNGDTDTNDSKDLTARVAVRPFNGWEGNPLRRFQVGIAGGIGVENEPVNPVALRTPLGVPFFQFNKSVYADGLRWRFSPEVAYFVGGFGCSAQYFGMGQRLRPAFFGAGSQTVIDVPFSGFYGQASYLLTGEERTGYSQAIAPQRPFDPRADTFGPGAWELLLRVSRLRAGDAVFAPGDARLADQTAYSRGATELTFGVNWYLNKWVRGQVNWEHAWFDSPVKLGPGANGIYSAQDTLGVRLQVIF